MDGPLVTIGMPAFNGEDTIANSVEALLGQTYANIELVISDNASTDSTQQICRRYEELDKRVRYYRNSENIGALENFNRLVGMGEGPLFMWAACDDLWEPEFVEELVGLLRCDPSAVLAFCQVDYLETTTGRAYPSRNIASLGRPGPLTVRLTRFLLFPEAESKASMMYGIIRRRALVEVGGLYRYPFGDSRFGADNHMLFLLAMHGDFAISDRVLFHKCFKPTEDIGAMMTSPSELSFEFRAYRQDAAESTLTPGQKLLVEGAAALSFCRRLGRNLLGKALVRMRLRSLEPMYHRSLFKIQNLFARKKDG